MKLNPLLTVIFLFICSICHSIPNIEQILNVAIPVVMYGGFILVFILDMVRHLDLPPNEIPHPNYDLAFEDFPAASKPYATYAIASPPLSATSPRTSLKLYSS